MAIYFLHALDDQGRPYDETVMPFEVFKDADYDGDAGPAAQAAYEDFAASGIYEWELVKFG
ncbi:hypothetical protein [Streptomyces filamentosus]|uniref:hypothetical protein n=1 Tax=Streptomyces filamentosus TaxID=67294 RepID=UPI00340AC914